MGRTEHERTGGVGDTWLAHWSAITDAKCKVVPYLRPTKHTPGAAASSDLSVEIKPPQNHLELVLDPSDAALKKE
jgi:hypothetical protein